MTEYITISNMYAPKNTPTIAIKWKLSEITHRNTQKPRIIRILKTLLSNEDRAMEPTKFRMDLEVLNKVTNKGDVTGICDREVEEAEIQAC